MACMVFEKSKKCSVVHIMIEPCSSKEDSRAACEFSLRKKIKGILMLSSFVVSLRNLGLSACINTF